MMELRTCGTLITVLVCLLAASVQAGERGSGTDKEQVGVTRAESTDDFVCTRCEDLLPAEVLARHLPNFSTPTNVSSATSCSPQCKLVRGEEYVLLRAWCGAKDHYESLMDAARPNETSGLLTKVDDSRPTRTEIVVWDNDTPCAFGLTWRGRDRLEETLLLAKGIAQVATPALMQRRTLEAVVIAEDATGDRAKQLLGRFEKLRPAVDSLLPVAADFPKVVDSSMHADWPAGKRSLVLGYCPNGLGDVVAKAVRAVFPESTFHRVAAGDMKESCPRMPAGLKLETSQEIFRLKGKGKTIRGASFWNRVEEEKRDIPLQDCPDDKPVCKPNPRLETTSLGYGVFYLFDSKDNLLDWKKIEYLRPEDKLLPNPPNYRPDVRRYRYYRTCSHRVAEPKKGDRIEVGVICEAWEKWKYCQEPEWETIFENLTIKGDRIARTPRKVIVPGEKCMTEFQ
jgi:hypothetical protein